MEEKHAPCVVCLGFFDGVHLAHQALLRAARAEGERLHLPVCVHTFDRAPGQKEFELTTLEEREALLNIRAQLTDGGILTFNTFDPSPVIQAQMMATTTSATPRASRATLPVCPPCCRATI